MKIMNVINKLSKHDIVTLFTALIAATGSIFAACIGLSVQNQIMECKLAINNCNDNINNINSEIASSITNINEIYNQYLEAAKTPQTLYNEAIYAYDSGDYKRVITIYANEQIANSPVALTNMGYLYENGYGVIQDFDKAEMLYNEALALDYELAYNHKLAMYITHKLSGLENIFYEGYLNDYESAASYLKCFFDENITADKAISIYCKEYTSEECMEFNKQFYEFNYIGIKSYPIPPKNDEFTLYVPISQHSTLSGVNYTYKVLISTPKNIDILSTGFIY